MSNVIAAYDVKADGMLRCQSGSQLMMSVLMTALDANPGCSEPWVRRGICVASPRTCEDMRSTKGKPHGISISTLRFQDGNAI